mmetsp:Transcript_1474/g.4728  ORF Transcript_1474/g.4728 Transcript_1474/m.4728 type:complete len:222 (-) Transcript_1474:1951-2616(-)
MSTTPSVWIWPSAWWPITYGRSRSPSPTAPSQATKAGGTCSGASFGGRCGTARRSSRHPRDSSTSLWTRLWRSCRTATPSSARTRRASRPSSRKKRPPLAARSRRASSSWRSTASSCRLAACCLATTPSRCMTPTASRSTSRSSCARRRDSPSINRATRWRWTPPSCGRRKAATSHAVGPSFLRPSRRSRLRTRWACSPLTIPQSSLGTRRLVPAPHSPPS